MAKINIEAYRKITHKDLVVDLTALGGELFTYRVSDHHIRRHEKLVKDQQAELTNKLKKLGLKITPQMANKPKLVEQHITSLMGKVEGVTEALEASDIHIKWFIGLECCDFEQLKQSFREAFPDLWETIMDDFLLSVYNEFVEELNKYSNYLGNTAKKSRAH